MAKTPFHNSVAMLLLPYHNHQLRGMPHWPVSALGIHKIKNMVWNELSLLEYAQDGHIMFKDSKQLSFLCARFITTQLSDQ